MIHRSFTVNTDKKIKSFSKTIKVDSDKSQSIRAFLIGSISHDVSRAKNILESEDVFATINCLRKLGVKIVKTDSKEYKIYGKGLGSLFCKKRTVLDCQNSGTLARLLVGILATTPDIDVTIKGDQSLNKRNMSKLIGLMREFGADFFPKNKNSFPLRLISSQMPIGLNQYTAGVSAQLKSAVILAALNSYGDTKIVERRRKSSRDHTEKILLNSPSTIKIIKGEKKIISIKGKKNLNSFNLNIPGDPSAAAFFTALTLLNKKSSIKIKNVGLNSKRIGFYECLKKNGAKIIFKNIKIRNNEKVGDILVNSSSLRSLKVNSYYYTRATDEYPIMFIIAALIPGISNFDGIEDLANKESNRIREMQKILKQVGIKTIYKNNQIKIFGNPKIKSVNKNIKVPNLGDHRICMSAMILSLITGIKSKIKNFETVRTSSPNFLNIINSLGGKFEIKKN